MWWRWPPHSRQKSGKSCRTQSTLHSKTFAHTPSSGTEPPPPRRCCCASTGCPTAFAPMQQKNSPSSEYYFICDFIRWSNHSMAGSALDRHAIPLFLRNYDHLPAEICLHFATTNSHLATHAHDILHTCNSNPTVVPRSAACDRPSRPPLRPTAMPSDEELYEIPSPRRIDRHGSEDFETHRSDGMNVFSLHSIHFNKFKLPVFFGWQILELLFISKSIIYVCIHLMDYFHTEKISSNQTEKLQFIKGAGAAFHKVHYCSFYHPYFLPRHRRDRSPR